MAKPPPRAEVSPEAVRTGMVGSPGPSRPCGACGKPLPDGKPSGACSNRCRAALNRQRKAEAQQARDREIVTLLDFAARLEARAADLRAQARGRLGKPTE
jgi:predicted nucleic acid-binding Zn ribbon protein